MTDAAIYPNAFGALQSGDLDWESLSIRGIILSQGFTYDGSLIYRDELNEAFVIAESEIMESPTRNGSVVTGKAIEWLQLSDNREAHHIVLFDDTGDDAYSQLIAYFPADCIEGFPFLLNGQNYYFYPVQPPGGFFQFGLTSEVIGPINTYWVTYPLALAESEGGSIYSIPCPLVFGLDLDVNERICLLPDALDDEECGPPTIRSSLCG